MHSINHLKALPKPSHWQALCTQTCPQVPFPQVKAIHCPPSLTLNGGHLRDIDFFIAGSETIDALTGKYRDVESLADNTNQKHSYGQIITCEICVTFLNNKGLQMS